MKAFRTKNSVVIGYSLLALVIVGLTGFGLGGSVSGLSVQNVARVGDEVVSTRDYSRALQNTVQQQSQRIGRTLTGEEVRASGLDRIVLARQVAQAALDGEAARLGLSVNDALVRDEIIKGSAFSGADGTFDKTAYQITLDRLGLSATEFERQVRRDLTRSVLQRAVASGVAAPETTAVTLLKYVREERTLEYLRLTPALVGDTLPAPTEAELQTEYDANPGSYTAPETRKVNYAALQPEALAATIEIDEAALKAAYDEHIDDYRHPERRAIERITFRDEAAADAALQQIVKGEATFDTIAAVRELTPEQLDAGEVTRADLDPAAADAVFGLSEPGIAGPAPSPLGPALYRVNAILAASETTFEEARDGLRQTLALDEARRQIPGLAEQALDLIAGGAELDELTELGFETGSLDVTDEGGDGLAADPDFLAEARAAEVGEDRDLIDLSDGGVAVLKVTEIVPPTLRPISEVTDEVTANWRAAETRKRLNVKADAMLTRLKGGETLSVIGNADGLVPQSQAGLVRGAFSADLPPAVLTALFGADEGEGFVAAAGDDVILGRVAAIVPFDPASEDNGAYIATITDQYSDEVASDLLDAYANALQAQAGVRIDAGLVGQIVNTIP